MPDGLIVLLVAGFFVALMFSFSWKILGKILFAGVMLLKVLLIIGLVVGATCCQQFYDMMGWTPISIVFGDRFYKHARIHHGKEQARRAVSRTTI